ncbi:MAG: VWA domain-containing protein [Pyrinomonadaceae bacterium]|nr:VWA domain-containing protein [Pyrinomonadaceae bacterium]MDQ3135876.1 VWA domain-containing protein [Acidobacteriota bacterium]
MYSAQITRANPTLIILLLDQSGSMADPFGGGEQHSSQTAARKADYVAGAVNHALHDLVIRCTKTEEVRNYYYVSIIGYGRTVGSAFTGLLADRQIAPISEVADNPARIEIGYKRVSDGAGGSIEMPVRYPVWIYPHADGGTPMCQALRQAQSILGQWLAQHPRGFPPTVLHLTDGESGDGDPLAPGRELMSLETDDGQVLLFNCHVSSRRANKIEYPEDARVLPDGFARTLFDISSPLPENFLGAAQQLGVHAVPGSRGFVFNADPSSVVQFYEIGTSLTGMAPHIWMDT